MPTKTFLLQHPDFQPVPLSWGTPKVVNLENALPTLNAEVGAEDSALLLAPASMRSDPVLQGLLNTGFPLTCIYFSSQTEMLAYCPSLDFLGSPKRGMGVKEILQKGSTIYSETLFNADLVGSRIDPCYRFALSTLGQKKAVEAWATLHALIFLGIRSLPSQGANGTGERVEVQIGADASRFAFTVRFDLAPEALVDLRRHALFDIPRGSVDIFECRYIASGKKFELTGVCLLTSSPGRCIEAQSFHVNSALETAQDAKEYSFRGFGSMSGTANEEKRVVKGGFKKKFSDQVTTLKADAPAPAAPLKATEEKIVDADAGNFLVTGEALVEHKPQPSEASLLEGKIQGLEAAVKQKDEHIAKLAKEIEQIKDPSKMGVISGIKDNQLEGLKANIARLEGELKESEGREKELMGVVDKAIQMKDEALKKIKELDLKVKQSSGGNSSKVQMLEKALEEQKRQNQALSKRVSQLTEQIQATGKRVA
jgi:hypothetical protein